MCVEIGPKPRRSSKVRPNRIFYIFKPNEVNKYRYPMLTHIIHTYIHTYIHIYT